MDDRTTIYQWLGPSARLSLWRVTTSPDGYFATVFLGRIVESGSSWEAWTAPSNIYAEGHRLRTLDDRIAAGRTLCAYHRVPMPDLPGSQKDRK